MVCRLMFFDYRESEKPFFEKTKPDNFNITFFNYPLNEDTIKRIPIHDIENTYAISVFSNSDITKKVIEKFKNLRIISTRSKDYSHIDIAECLNKNIAVVNVETPWTNSENYVLLQSFKSITGVLCGCKENRIV